MSLRSSLSTAALLAATLSACVVPDGAVPQVDLATGLATKYVHRGMVQNEEGVMQSEAVMVLPAEKDGAIVARAWGNMDLSNDTGDAWLPDGHAGKFSQIDFNLLYVQSFENASVTAGFINYNLPNGLEFPFGERGATSEFLVEGQMQLSEKYFSIVPSLAIHYDFDEVEGFYIRTGVERAFPINDQLTITSDLGLAWMDGDQAFWNFAEPGSSGLGDLTLRGTAEYVIDDHTTATGFLAYSTLLASAYRDWFDLIGINPDQFFLGLGVRWSY